MQKISRKKKHFCRWKCIM